MAAIFKYKLPTVGTLNDLFADYPDGGQYGMFAYVSTQSKYAWWNHTLATPQWELTTETPVTPQGGIPTGPDTAELSDFAILKYLKDPVVDVNELMARYPDGGEHGWFMIVTSLNAFAWWNDTKDPAQWYILGGGTSGGGGGAIGGGDTYTNTLGVPTKVGGINAGTTFNAKTMQEMWDALLYPDTPPVVEDPTYSITHNQPSQYAEVGATPDITFTNDFYVGKINPLWTYNQTTKLWEAKADEPRVGNPTYEGVTNGEKTIVLGSNTFQRTATFAQGAQPRTSKGNYYKPRYPENTPTGTLTASVTITGVYPVFATRVSENEFVKLAALQNHGTALDITTADGISKIRIPAVWWASWVGLIIEFWDIMSGDTDKFKSTTRPMFGTPTDVTVSINGADVAYKEFIGLESTSSRRFRFRK